MLEAHWALRWPMDGRERGEDGLGKRLGGDFTGLPNSGLSAKKLDDAVAAGGCGQWEASGGRLQQGIGHTFESRGKYEERSTSVIRGGFGHEADKRDAGSDPEALCKLAKRNFLGSAAQDGEMNGGMPRLNRNERLEEQVQPFFSRETAGGEKTGRRQGRPKWRFRRGNVPNPVPVDWVGENHQFFPAYPKLAGQIRRHGARLADDPIRPAVEEAIERATEPGAGGERRGGVLADEETCAGWEERLEKQQHLVQVRHTGEDDAWPDRPDQLQKPNRSLANSLKSEPMDADLGWKWARARTVFGDQPHMDIEKPGIEMTGQLRGDVFRASPAQMGNQQE